MQAEGAAPLVKQAKQQERGTRQRGVSHGQVLAEGRHGTASTSETGKGPGRRTQQFLEGHSEEIQMYRVTKCIQKRGRDNRNSCYEILTVFQNEWLTWQNIRSLKKV